MGNPWIVRIWGIVIFAIGLCLYYIISRRKFKRRAMTGLEGFRSYEKAWSTTLAERIGRVIAKLLIIVGIIIFLLSFVNRMKAL